MCDTPANSAYKGWRGWMPLPAAKPGKPLGEWVDLTHPLSPDVPRVGMFPPPKFTRVAEMPAKPLNVTHMEMVVHMGTHLDSPRHFFMDGPAMEAIPLDRLMGPGVVLRIAKPPYGVIEPDDLERSGPAIRAGDIVAIDTGWAERWGTPDWDRQPCLSVAARTERRRACSRGRSRRNERTVRQTPRSVSVFVPTHSFSSLSQPQVRRAARHGKSRGFCP